jgi:hypothetical protein
VKPTGIVEHWNDGILRKKQRENKGDVLALEDGHPLFHFSSGL